MLLGCGKGDRAEAHRHQKHTDTRKQRLIGALGRHNDHRRTDKQIGAAVFEARKYLTAQIYISELDFSNKIKNIERQIIELSTKRYITKNIDYKLCYNYIFSQAYFGNNQYGLENGSQYYFQKNYKNLTEKEFVSLCLLVKNPIFYDLSKERNFEEGEKIYQKING